MRRLKFFLNLICTFILFSSLHVQGMEIYQQDDCLLTKLPTEILMHTPWLSDKIVMLMKLSTTCRYFNQLLTFEKMGEFCKSYDQSTKYCALAHVLTKGRYFSTNEVVGPTGSLKYEVKRLPVLILLCAGVDITKQLDDPMFITAFGKKDLQLVEMMFKNYPNQKLKKEKLGPMFRWVSTVEMAQLFVDNDCFDYDINYLLRMIRSRYPLDLMEFCVKHGMCPRKLDTTGYCLLHVIACDNETGSIENQHDIETFLNKAKFLLGIIPDMINTMSTKKNFDLFHNTTPLDVAYESLECLKDRQRYQTTVKEKILAFEQLAALFWEHGALTAQQLAEQKGMATQ